MQEIVSPPPSSLTEKQMQIALALAEAIIPGSRTIPPADEATLFEVEKLLEHLSSHLPNAWARAQQALDSAALLRTGSRFHRLSKARQQSLLEAWEQDPVMRVPLGLVAMAYKFIHFDRSQVYQRLGGKLNVVEQLEEPRWLQQVSKGEDWVGEDDIEAEVIVVGTGAGGAVVGRELAEKGFAVAFVEEGDLIRRDRFTGSSRKAHMEFYRGAFSIGNAPMPVFIGKLVGGSTAVNGGTCFKTPPWILEEWCEQLDTEVFTPEAMEPHFDRVFDILRVEAADSNYIGPIANIMQRGADALGWSHFPILRNAPGCQGSGFCDFGCRTDARRSTNISYIPPALERGSSLITELRADRLILEKGRAAGVECRTKTGRKVRLRAPTVIFAGGAIPTPIFLMKQGLCNSSGELGKNLSLHPSTGLAALFDEQIRGQQYIPQGYGIDHFNREGILISAAQPDLNIAAIVFPTTGERLMKRLDQIDNIANFGILIKDESRGRVYRGPSNRPIISYQMSEKDISLMKRAIMVTAEMAKAAGAKEIYPAVLPASAIKTDQDWKNFEDRKLNASDLQLTSYHPLGTCKMGRDPRTSVVDLDHQTHDIKGLYIVDGSTVPGPTAVNPQITIMALATRAAERIADKIS